MLLKLQFAEAASVGSRALEEQDAWVTSMKTFNQSYRTEMLSTDVPTGTTPGKKLYPFPTKFTTTSPHSRIIARHRGLAVDPSDVTLKL